MVANLGMYIGLPTQISPLEIASGMIGGINCVQGRCRWCMVALSHKRSSEYHQMQNLASGVFSSHFCKKTIIGKQSAAG